MCAAVPAGRTARSLGRGVVAWPLLSADRAGRDGWAPARSADGVAVGVFDGPRPQAAAEEAGAHVGGIAAHARVAQGLAFVGACGDVLGLAAAAAGLLAAGLVTAAAAASVLVAPLQGLCQPADGARREDDLGSACVEQAIDQRDHCRGALGTLTGEQSGAVAELRGSLPSLVGVGQRFLRMTVVPSSAGGCFWHLGRPSWS